MKMTQSINRQLLLGCVLSSALMTALLTAFQLAMAYQDRVAYTEGKLANVAKVNHPALANSLWDLNQTQIVSTLSGVQRADSVDYAHLHFEGIAGASDLEIGKLPQQSLQKSFSIKMEEKRWARSPSMRT